MTDEAERKAWEVEQAWSAVTPPGIIAMRRRWMLQRYEEQGALCAYCGDIMVVMTLDQAKERPDLATNRATCEHVTPHCLGGLDDLENVVAACHGCNTIKANLPPRLFVGWIQGAQARGLVADQMRQYLRLEAQAYRLRLQSAKVEP